MNTRRVIIFMAGGATYSESRVCYETGRSTSREVFLVTSHMQTPNLFLRQLSDLSADRRRLGIPSEQPKPKPPSHLFEPDESPRTTTQTRQSAQQQSADANMPRMGNLNLNSNSAPGQPVSAVQANSSAKLTKDPEKKKRHHFGFGKKDKS